MLKRYWFVTSEDKFGPRNFGVTAFSSEQARALLNEALIIMEWQYVSKEAIDKAEIVENIDVRTLDDNHVLLNIGVVSRQGVWFPNCNS